MSCEAPGCSSSAASHDAGVVFHHFPMDQPALLRRWVGNVGRKDWRPDRNSVLCSKHFEVMCYGNRDVQEKLKRNSVPTIFIQSRKQSKLSPTFTYSKYDTYESDTSPRKRRKREIPMKAETLSGPQVQNHGNHSNLHATFNPAMRSSFGSGVAQSGAFNSRLNSTGNLISKWSPSKQRSKSIIQVISKLSNAKQFPSNAISADHSKTLAQHVSPSDKYLVDRKPVSTAKNPSVVLEDCLKPNTNFTNQTKAPTVVGQSSRTPHIDPTMGSGTNPTLDLLALLGNDLPMDRESVANLLDKVRALERALCDHMENLPSTTLDESQPDSIKNQYNSAGKDSERTVSGRTLQKQRSDCAINHMSNADSFRMDDGDDDDDDTHGEAAYETEPTDDEAYDSDTDYAEDTASGCSRSAMKVKKRRAVETQVAKRRRHTTHDHRYWQGPVPWVNDGKVIFSGHSHLNTYVPEAKDYFMVFLTKEELPPAKMQRLRRILSKMFFMDNFEEKGIQNQYQHESVGSETKHR